MDAPDLDTFLAAVPQPDAESEDESTAKQDGQVGDVADGDKTDGDTAN